MSFFDIPFSKGDRGYKEFYKILISQNLPAIVF